MHSIWGVFFYITLKGRVQSGLECFIQPFSNAHSATLSISQIGTKCNDYINIVLYQNKKTKKLLK